MRHFFIDKLNMYQRHSQKLPLIGSNGFLKIDLQSGEVSDEPTVFTRQIEGSYSTKLFVRCNGYVVSVTGNPSRWHRVDNLEGIKTIDGCVDVYNTVLEKLGLPPFTKNTWKGVKFLQSRNDKFKRIGNGAVITHIDWTRNHSVGYGNEQSFLKAMSTQTIDKSISPFLYPNENTVEWFSKNVQGNGSRRRYLKMYAKAADMIKHMKKNLSGADPVTYEYYQKLLQFVIEQGIVREEHSFKSMWLTDNRLELYGITKESDFTEHLKSIDIARKRLEVTNMKLENIAQQLLDKGIVKTQLAANTTQSYYMMWLHGHYLDTSKRQFRDHNARLKQLGIDLRVKLDISRSPLRLREAQIIEVKPIVLPTWYRHHQQAA